MFRRTLVLHPPNCGHPQTPPRLGVNKGNESLQQTENPKPVSLCVLVCSHSHQSALLCGPGTWQGYVRQSPEPHISLRMTDMRSGCQESGKQGLSCRLEDTQNVVSHQAHWPLRGHLPSAFHLPRGAGLTHRETLPHSGQGPPAHSQPQAVPGGVELFTPAGAEAVEGGAATTGALVSGGNIRSCFLIFNFLREEISRNS